MTTSIYSVLIISLLIIRFYDGYKMAIMAISSVFLTRRENSKAMASLPDSIIGQCLRPVLNYPSWLQYDEERCDVVEDYQNQTCKHHDQGQPQGHLSQQTQQTQQTQVNWHPNDPENPHNWPSTKKAFVTFVIGFYSFVVYMSAPIYTPSVEAFRDEFGVNAAEGSLGLALYVYASLSLFLLSSSSSSSPTSLVR